MLQGLLAEKASALVKELVGQVLDKEVQIDECLNMLLRTLPPGSTISERLLESFAITMSTPTRDKPSEPPSLASPGSLPGLWKKNKDALTSKTRHPQRSIALSAYHRPQWFTTALNAYPGAR